MCVTKNNNKSDIITTTAIVPADAYIVRGCVVVACHSLIHQVSTSSNRLLSAASISWSRVSRGELDEESVDMYS